MAKTPIKVMSIEDDSDIQAVTRFALEDIGGFSVEICDNGVDALKAIPKFKPDLILLDAMMPNMDGPETLLALRKLPESKETPVVFMTAKVMPRELEKYRMLSAQDVITKPFDPLTLSDRVQEIWRQWNE